MIYLLCYGDGISIFLDIEEIKMKLLKSENMLLNFLIYG